MAFDNPGRRQLHKLGGEIRIARQAAEIVSSIFFSAGEILILPHLGRSWHLVDIGARGIDLGFWHIADKQSRLNEVRYQDNSADINLPVKRKL